MKIALQSLKRQGHPSLEYFEVRNPGVIALLCHTSSFTFEGKNYQILGEVGGTLIWQERQEMPIGFTREDFES